MERLRALGSNEATRQFASSCWKRILTNWAAQLYFTDEQVRFIETRTYNQGEYVVGSVEGKPLSMHRCSLPLKMVSSKFRLEKFSRDTSGSTP